MLIYVLFFLTVAILFVVLANNKMDYMTPTVLFIAPLTVSIMFAMVYSEEWDVNLCFETFSLLLLGFISFFIGEMIGKSLAGKKVHSVIARDVFGGTEGQGVNLSIKKRKYVLMICYEIISFIIYYRAIVSVVSTSGKLYVLFDSTYAKTAVSNVGFGVSTIYKVAIVFAYICLLHLSYNILRKSGTKISYLCDIVVISIYLFSILITGSRGDIINFSVSMVFMFYIIFCKFHGWKTSTIGKTVKKVIPAVILIVLVFYILKNIVNKSGQHDINLLNMVSSYMGAQIDLLDGLVKGDIQMPQYPLFGYESFYNLYQFFGKAGLIRNMTSITFKYKAYNMIGCNVYTFFRRPYVDFGFWGCLIMTMLCGDVFGYLYYKMIKNRYITKESLLSLLIYSFFINKVFMAFFDDYISFQVSVNAVIMIVLFRILYKYIFGKTINHSRKMI
jgi:oligosaccharide repeat unit polymerase